MNNPSQVECTVKSIRYQWEKKKKEWFMQIVCRLSSSFHCSNFEFCESHSYIRNETRQKKKLLLRCHHTQSSMESIAVIVILLQCTTMCIFDQMRQSKAAKKIIIKLISCFINTRERERWKKKKRESKLILSFQRIVRTVCGLFFVHICLFNSLKGIIVICCRIIDEPFSVVAFL